MSPTYIHTVCCRKYVCQERLLEISQRLVNISTNLRVHRQKDPVWGTWCCHEYLNYAPPVGITSRMTSQEVAEYFTLENHRKQFEMYQNDNSTEFIPIKTNQRLNWLIGKL